MTNRNRGKQLNFRLSETELEKFHENVEKSRLKQSEYLRKCILEKDIVIIDEIKELMGELKRIGNNLNQLTRAVNSGEFRNIDSLEMVKNELEVVWNEVIQALKKVNE
ncbi:plasmid mobilization protein [Haloimpatiens sp. FM7315]|uniref:plasmid mobilization protein n=1 Tax=Haloimpatiens sp. FM7315 TaxID=3298609 RepID=UPI0035A31D2E